MGTGELLSRLEAVAASRPMRLEPTIAPGAERTVNGGKSAVNRPAWEGCTDARRTDAHGQTP
jgi:hypothetical protein